MVRRRQPILLVGHGWEISEDCMGRGMELWIKGSGIMKDKEFDIHEGGRK